MAGLWSIRVSGNWRWSASVGATRVSGCGCRRLTNWRRSVVGKRLERRTAWRRGHWDTHPTPSTRDTAKPQRTPGPTRQPPNHGWRLDVQGRGQRCAPSRRPGEGGVGGTCRQDRGRAVPCPGWIAARTLQSPVACPAPTPASPTCSAPSRASAPGTPASARSLPADRLSGPS